MVKVFDNLISHLRHTEREFAGVFKKTFPGRVLDSQLAQSSNICANVMTDHSKIPNGLHQFFILVALAPSMN